MKLHNLMKELGSVTVLEHLHRSPIDITPMQQEAGCLMPMSIVAGKEAINFRGVLGKQLNIIANKERRKQIVLVGPELIVLETLASLDVSKEVLVAIESDLNPEIVERIRKNTPKGINAKIIQIPKLPEPSDLINATMVIIGFDGGGNFVLLPISSKSILSFYLPNYFFGEVILLDLLGYPCFDRPYGWVTINKSKYFTQHLTLSRFKR